MMASSLTPGLLSQRNHTRVTDSNILNTPQSHQAIYAPGVLPPSGSIPHRVRSSRPVDAKQNAQQFTPGGPVPGVSLYSHLPPRTQPDPCVQPVASETNQCLSPKKTLDYAEMSAVAHLNHDVPTHPTHESFLRRLLGVAPDQLKPTFSSFGS